MLSSDPWTGAGIGGGDAQRGGWEVEEGGWWGWGGHTPTEPFLREGQRRCVVRDLPFSSTGGQSGGFSCVCFSKLSFKVTEGSWDTGAHDLSSLSLEGAVGPSQRQRPSSAGRPAFLLRALQVPGHAGVRAGPGPWSPSGQTETPRPQTNKGAGQCLRAGVRRRPSRAPLQAEKH